MLQIKSIKEANKLLAEYVPQVKELLGKDITLRRMMPLMALLDNPQDKIKIIHIAGTSGKTSTAYYMAGLLQANGSRVGLTVSPHIDSVTERIQINLVPISEVEFCESLSEFMQIISSVELKPTYFELLIAFVFWYFAKQKVDYAVIETGLGGLHDATNIAKNADKVCIITDIGLDHMHVLGDSLSLIAAQKAGIIHPGNQVFMHQQSSEIMHAFEEKVASQKATLNKLSKDYIESRKGIESMPNYQKRNWLLAKFAYDYIVTRDNIRKISDQQLSKTMSVYVPGRMDTIHVDGKTIIMDGAHNQQKIEALVDSYRAKYPQKSATILLALKQGKEYQEVLPLLKPICDELVLTSFETTQDMPIHAIDPAEIAEHARLLGFTKITVEPDYDKAYQTILNSSNEMVIVTGSFYLLSCLRPLILKK